MSSYLMPHTTLPELGEGAGYFLLAFRGIAFGNNKCNCLNRYFEDRFGEAGKDILADITGLARLLGNVGQRRIRLAHPGCGRVSHDEVSILSALSAAGKDEQDQVEAHLNWLLAGRISTDTIILINDIAARFRSFERPIKAPPPMTVPSNTLPDKASLGVAGIA